MPWTPAQQEINLLTTDLKQKGVNASAIAGWIQLLKEASGKKQAFALLATVADYPELKLLHTYGFALIGGNSPALIKQALKNAPVAIAAAKAQSQLNEQINGVRDLISTSHNDHLGGTAVAVPISKNINGISESIAKKYNNGEKVLPDNGQFYIEWYPVINNVRSINKRFFTCRAGYIWYTEGGTHYGVEDGATWYNLNGSNWTKWTPPA